ncbi:hypothetical protein D3C87_259920 [compost metagenome]
MKACVLILSSLFVMACSTGPCRSTANAAEAGSAVAVGGVSKKSPKTEEVAVKTSSAERVKVAKMDGTLQCGQGKLIPLAEMQKQLKDIKVHSSMNKNDGMMRIQVCGSPTGNFNVYEIDRKDLDAALGFGFKEWTAE